MNKVDYLEELLIQKLNHQYFYKVSLILITLSQNTINIIFAFSEKAGCISTRQNFTYTKMDNTKIYDPQLSDRRKSSWIHTHLDSKLDKASVSTQQTFKSNPTSRLYCSKILPKYHFEFGKHIVGDSVEYEVELTESFTVFQKTISQKYYFKTRYSKLESLHNKAGGQGFPPKRFFGNKNQVFIEERKRLLEKYLNQLCDEQNPEIFNFIWQIKQVDMKSNYKKMFRLPA